MSLIHVATFFDHAEYQRTRWKSNEEHFEMPLDRGLVVPKNWPVPKSSKRNSELQKTSEWVSGRVFQFLRANLNNSDTANLLGKRLYFCWMRWMMRNARVFIYLWLFLNSFVDLDVLRNSLLFFNASLFNSDWGGYLRYAIDSQLHCFVTMLPVVFYGPNIHWKQTRSADSRTSSCCSTSMSDGKIKVSCVSLSSRVKTLPFRRDSFEERRIRFRKRCWRLLLGTFVSFTTKKNHFLNLVIRQFSPHLLTCL